MNLHPNEAEIRASFFDQVHECSIFIAVKLIKTSHCIASMLVNYPFKTSLCF